MSQILPLVVVVVLVVLAALWYRRTQGAVRSSDARFTAAEVRALGLPQRRSALLLFTAPGCASCAAAKRVLDDVGGSRGIPVVVADVTEHPDIVKAQHVYRAPTVFVVEDHGRAVSRISGVPNPRELDAAIDAAAAA